MKRYSPLLLILVLLGALAASPGASAASTTPATPTTFPQLSLRDAASEEAEEAEAEEEFEIEECEATAEEFEFEEEEFEEFEIEEECGAEEAKGSNSESTFVTAPAACRVRRAESSITTLPGSNRVQLTVHYLAYSPAAVTVDLKLKDEKGTVAIEHTTKHLGAKGVLHLTVKLGDAVMERAAKAQEFDVALRAVNTPGYCGELLEQQLKSKHPVGKGRVYTGPPNRNN